MTSIFTQIDTYGDSAIYVPNQKHSLGRTLVSIKSVYLNKNFECYGSHSLPKHNAINEIMPFLFLK